MPAKFVNLIQPEKGLSLPLKELPLMKTQRRKQQAKSSLSETKMCGADTETVDGRVWLFSTEYGVWEIDTLQTLIEVMFNKYHRSKWKQGKGKNQKTTHGWTTKEFFFWNLKYDAQAILKLEEFTDEDIDGLLNGDKVTVDCERGQVEVKYLEGKFMMIQPKDWFEENHRIGKILWWDISQFYNKMRLNDASAKFLNDSKIDVCFDGSVLDAGRFGEAEYRDFYREDIEKYAVKDAVLCGELARMRRNDFVSQDVRFIMPYSVANVAQRNMLDLCKLPTMNNFKKSEDGHAIIQRFLSMYQGGWFTTSGCGTFGNGNGDSCLGVDLVSAYPYVMYHLPDITKGTWIRGNCQESFESWLDRRKPMSLGGAEVYAVFEKGLPFYPLVKPTKKGTMVGARIVKGWFTADEIAEARKWPHVKFKIGEWIKFEHEEVYPLRPFIDRFYNMKMNSEKDSVPYIVSKLCLNSGYGKLIQCINGNIGQLWNPMLASVCTGSTRARLSEIIRLNNFKALSVATDGIIFPKENLNIIPDRPLEAPFNLGRWEIEVYGDLIVQKSGVYSVINDEYCKTTFRGNASYFLRDYKDGGLFRFCEDYSSEPFVQIEVTRPLSAKQARMKSDFDLINIFTPQDETMTAFVMSDKRRFLERPRIFQDLLDKWWPSMPQERL
tara:strand:- start:1045 stop:3036 length:1992 start_codon:yes stop_codon:yes gene_type:complete